MERFRVKTLAAMAIVLCDVAGCGQKHDSPGPRPDLPPVAPMPEPDVREGGDAGPIQRPPAEAPDRHQPVAAAGNQTRAAAWPFRPATLRLHPLTHALQSEDAVSVIEARVEFFDRFGDTTKGLGVLHFELHATDGAGRGRRLASWEIDVSDVDANMRHYDDVTRTYLFRLGLEGVGERPPSARLDVTATMPNQQMSGSLDIALR